MRAIRVLKHLALLLGGAMLAGAALMVVHTRSFIAHALRADGEVVELVSRESDNSTTYAPTVRYTTADGQTVQFTSSSSSSPPAFSVGEKVRVLYPAGEPGRAKIDSFFSLWAGAVILGSFGAGCAAAGGAVFLLASFARRREEDLLLRGTPVQADFQSVELNTQLAVNGRHPYRVLVQWRNPATSKIHIFHSRNLWYDPTQYIDRKQLTVYLDTANPKRYLVDVSFLPELT